MSSPTKDELPRIADSLASEIAAEHKLKHADTQEKIILPSAEDVQQEKGHQEFLKGIESFDDTKLKHAETQEKNPLPTQEEIAKEKATAWKKREKRKKFSFFSPRIIINN